MQIDPLNCDWNGGIPTLNFFRKNCFGKNRWNSDLSKWSSGLSSSSTNMYVCMGFIELITALILWARSQDSLLSVSGRRVHVVFSTAGFKGGGRPCPKTRDFSCNFKIRHFCCATLEISLLQHCEISFFPWLCSFSSNIMINCTPHCSFSAVREIRKSPYYYSSSQSSLMHWFLFYRQEKLSVIQ